MGFWGKYVVKDDSGAQRESAGPFLQSVGNSLVILLLFSLLAISLVVFGFES